MEPTIVQITQLIASVSTLIGIIIGGYISIRNGRGIKSVLDVAVETKDLTNGMKTELVQATKEKGEALVAVARHEGRDEEREKKESALIQIPVQPTSLGSSTNPVHITTKDKNE